jgi:hypothetical protein
MNLFLAWLGAGRRLTNSEDVISHSFDRAAAFMLSSAPLVWGIVPEIYSNRIRGKVMGLVCTFMYAVSAVCPGDERADARKNADFWLHDHKKRNEVRGQFTLKKQLS